MRMLGTSKFAKCKLAKDNRMNPRRDEPSKEIIRLYIDEARGGATKD